MRCSIVILNWNGAEMLRRFLPSVVACCPDDCEVVVADNGSTDQSIELLTTSFPSVRRIILDRNYGFAEGYNRALMQIGSTYCVLLNSDVRVTEGWLQPLLQLLDDQPNVAAVQPNIRAEYDREDAQKENRPCLFEHAGAAGGYIDLLGYPYCRGRIMGHLEHDHGQYAQPAEVHWVSGACLVTRTALFREMGGLDDAFFAHMEEIDFCWRLRCRGYQLICLPEATVYHLGGGALPYESPRKTYLNFRNCLLMLYKNLPWLRLIWLLPVRCLLDYVASLQYLLKGQAANAWAVVRARFDYHKMRHTPSMYRKRKRNIAKLLVRYPVFRPFSILIAYYLLGKKEYHQLYSTNQ